MSHCFVYEGHYALAQLRLRNDCGDVTPRDALLLQAAKSAYTEPIYQASTMSETKTCNDCGESKAMDDFAMKNKAAGTRHAKCKECQRKYAKQHYASNKPEYVAKARRHNDEYIERNRRIVREYLADKACSCGCEDDLMTYTAGKEGVQPTWVAVNSGLSERAVREALKQSTIMCKECYGQHSVQSILEWCGLTESQRLELHQRKREQGLDRIPATFYRSYVRKDETEDERDERLLRHLARQEDRAAVKAAQEAGAYLAAVAAPRRVERKRP